MTEDTTQTSKQSGAQWKIEEFEYLRPNDSIRIFLPNGFRFECRTRSELILLLSLCLANVEGREAAFGDGTRVQVVKSLDDEYWLGLIDSDPWINEGFTFSDNICMTRDLGGVILQYLLERVV